MEHNTDFSGDANCHFVALHKRTMVAPPYHGDAAAGATLF
jgi:hypothetical protein